MRREEPVAAVADAVEGVAAVAGGQGLVRSRRRTAWRLCGRIAFDAREFGQPHFGAVDGLTGQRRRSRARESTTVPVVQGRRLRKLHLGGSLLRHDDRDLDRRTGTRSMPLDVMSLRPWRIAVTCQSAGKPATRKMRLPNRPSMVKEPSGATWPSSRARGSRSMVPSVHAATTRVLATGGEPAAVADTRPLTVAVGSSGASPSPRRPSCGQSRRRQQRVARSSARRDHVAALAKAVHVSDAVIGHRDVPYLVRLGTHHAARDRACSPRARTPSS